MERIEGKGSLAHQSGTLARTFNMVMYDLFERSRSAFSDSEKSYPWALIKDVVTLPWTVISACLQYPQVNLLEKPNNRIAPPKKLEIQHVPVRNFQPDKEFIPQISSAAISPKDDAAQEKWWKTYPSFAVSVPEHKPGDDSHFSKAHLNLSRLEKLLDLCKSCPDEEERTKIMKRCTPSLNYLEGLFKEYTPGDLFSNTTAKLLNERLPKMKLDLKHLEKTSGSMNYIRPECVCWIYEQPMKPTIEKIADIIKKAKIALEKNDFFMLSYIVGPVIRFCYTDEKWKECLGQTFYQLLEPAVVNHQRTSKEQLAGWITRAYDILFQTKPSALEDDMVPSSHGNTKGAD